MKKNLFPLLTCFLPTFLIVSCGQLSSGKIIDKTELTIVDMTHDTIPSPGFAITFEAADDTSLHLKLFVTEEAIKDSSESLSNPLPDSLYKLKEVIIDTVYGNYITKVIFTHKSGDVAFNATSISALKMARKNRIPIYIDRSLLRSLQ
jgi:hypothetical protein